MGWNSVNTTGIDIKKHKGTAYEGTYKGKHEITTKIGQQVIWELSGDDGVAFGIYGFTNLNRAMEALEPGVLVRIVYTGTLNCETKFGMKDVHQCPVEVWSEDTPLTEEEKKKLPF